MYYSWTLEQKSGFFLSLFPANTPPQPLIQSGVPGSTVDTEVICYRPLRAELKTKESVHGWVWYPKRRPRYL